MRRLLSFAGALATAPASMGMVEDPRATRLVIGWAIAARLIAAAWSELCLAWPRVTDEGAGAVVRVLRRLPRALLFDGILIAVGLAVLAIATRAPFARHARRALSAWGPWAAVMTLEAMWNAWDHQEPAGNVHRAAQFVGGIAWLVSLVAIVRVARGPEQTARAPGRPFAGLAWIGATAATLALGAAWGASDGAHLRAMIRGSEAPAFRVTTLDGATLSLEDARGKPLVLAFWATWCGPCLRELPTLDRVNARAGVRIVAVEIEGSEAGARGIAARLALSLPIALGDEAMAARYGAVTLPHLVLIDGAGRIARVMRGGYSEREIEEAITALR